MRSRSERRGRSSWMRISRTIPGRVIFGATRGDAQKITLPGIVLEILIHDDRHRLSIRERIRLLRGVHVAARARLVITRSHQRRPERLPRRSHERALRRRRPSRVGLHPERARARASARRGRDARAARARARRNTQRQRRAPRARPKPTPSARPPPLAALDVVRVVAVPPIAREIARERRARVRRRRRVVAAQHHRVDRRLASPRRRAARSRAPLETRAARAARVRRPRRARSTIASRGAAATVADAATRPSNRRSRFDRARARWVEERRDDAESRR